MLCGDLNINSDQESVKYIMDRCEAGMKFKNTEALEDWKRTREEYANSYQELLDVLSMFGEKKITDCLQVNIDKMDKDTKDDVKITYCDINKDKEGNIIPKESYLTVSDDFFNKERLDYIFIMDEKEEDSHYGSPEFTSLISKSKQINSSVNETIIQEDEEDPTK